MTSKGERPSCRAQSSRVSWMRARVRKAAQGLATIVAIATAFTFTARADYTVIDSSTTALALGGASGGDEIRRIDNGDGTFDLIHIFTNTASAQTFTLPDNSRIKADQIRLLIVGGGGSGYGNCGGGGGAGGVVTNTIAFPAGAYEVTVGAGGLSTAHEGASSAHNGAASVISNKIAQAAVVSALGGGHGGGYNKIAATSGGSGGGGGHRLAGVSGTSDQGNAGGNGYASSDFYGGGGGGAGAAGSNGTNGYGGAGGDGIELDITGEAVWYAGGGGGAGFNANTGGAGGKGGGGAGGCASANGHNNVAKAGFDGEPGTGGGGGGGASGGGSTAFGGAGGSGIVVIRYTVLNILEDGSLLYTYTNTNSVNQLILSKAALSRILLVGGGGAGASPGTIPNSPSGAGAGGGGAGGFIDVTNLLFSGSYTITVGAGGAAGGTTMAAGESGKDSAIVLGGSDVLRAYGGGGGGVSNLVAKAGGSGGGGSLYATYGAATQPVSVWGGFGNRGGSVNHNRAGAGGGGAGGAGSDSTANARGTNGGSGKTSNITGDVVSYAAGGGGGTRAGSNVGLGGLGDGTGNGGGGTTAVATAGKNGTGSGGGGGGSGAAGAPGGSGIVIVRILRYMPDKPESAEYEFVYDGTEHSFYSLVAPEANGVHWVLTDDVDASPYTITLGGESVTRIAVTAVGTYTFTVALKQEYLDQGYVWDDGSTADQVVTVKVKPQALADVSLALAGWQIGEAPSVPTLTANLTLTGESSEGTHDGDYYFEYSSDGTSWKTFSEWYAGALAGTHYIKAVIRTDSPNFTWSSENDPVESFSLWSYTEGKYPDYLGYHADISVTNATDETLTDFPILFVISEGTPVGFSYDQCATDGSDIRFTQTITEIDEETGLPTNRLVQLAFSFVNGWNPSGETRVLVTVPRYAQGIPVMMHWGRTTTGEVPDAPTPTVKYRDLTVENYTGSAPLTDFPMLVRLSEGVPSGFRYADCAADGSDLRFGWIGADGTTKVLPYELDGGWNTNGTTLAWVKVPKYANGYVATMIWGGATGGTGGGASEVWSDYAGVWHFGELADGTSEVARDSTANDAVGATNGVATVNVGVFGTALGQTAQNGPLLTVTPNDAINSLTGGAFRVSFWMYLNSDTVNVAYLFGRRTQTNNQEGWGAEFWKNVLNDTTYEGYTVSPIVMYTGASGSGQYCTQRVPGIVSGAWMRYDFTYSNGRYDCWINGVCEPYTTGGPLPINGPRDFAIGGAPGMVESLAINGSIDEFRLRAIPSGEVAADRIAAEYQQAGTLPYAWSEFGADDRPGAGGSNWTTPSIVTPQTEFANRWTIEPSFSASELNQGTDPFAYLSRGAAVYGTVTYAYYTVGGEAVADITTAPAGTYTVRVWVEAGEWGTCRWAQLGPCEFTFTLVAIQPYTILGTNVVTRILLGNDDTNPLGPVTNQQSYALSEADGGLAYWVHQGDYSSSMFVNLKPGATNMLYSATDVAEICGGTLLWYLENVRLGNLYLSSDLTSKDPDTNYLPQSPTATEFSHLVMRNIEGAAIYSPCYTNGIGTIYFDAVNAVAAGAGDYYNIELQICTDTNYLTTAAPPSIPASAWMAVEMMPLLTTDGTTFTQLKATNNLALAVTTGGTDRNFYRVYVPVEKQTPVRFRIVRTSHNSSLGEDAANFILIDNVIASHPAMRVDLSPYYGDVTYDASRTGEAVLGWAGSFDVPLPGVGDALKGRARTTVSGGALGQAADTAASGLVANAQLWYRWRYLAQETVPEEGWRSVSLDPLNGFASNEALTLPDGRRGDVEFYFTARLSAPYYDYVDYSGLGLGLGGFYTENIASVTNSFGAAANLPSLGEDWFVRLREGASDCEGVNLVVSNLTSGAVSTNAFTLAASRTWQAFYETPTRVADGLAFRIDVANEQTVGETSWATNASHYIYRTADGAMATVFLTGQTEVTNETAFSTPIEVDAATGYLMFQFDEVAKGISIVHAERQTFNGWDDAAVKSDKRLFTGSSVELTERTGVATEKKEYVQSFAGWGTMPATNPNWTMPNPDWSAGNMYGRRLYTDFQSDVSGGWSVGPGQWVAQNYRSSTGPVALLMKGNADGTGQGYAQYVVKDSDTPRGLESISFNARLGQTVGFNDFNYCQYEVAQRMKNYTFAARVAYDTNGFSNFTGAASLSLAAYYRPGVGCYEFRMEQLGGTSSGIDRRSQVFSLHRWRRSTSVAGYEDVQLGCWTNSSSFYIPVTRSLSTGGYFLPMYMSVSNGTDRTYIMAGTYHSYSNDNPPNQTNNGITPTAPLPSGSDASHNYTKFYYVDADSSKRLQNGTFGAVSANCPGVILQPTKYAAPLPILHTDITAANTFYAKVGTGDTYNRIIFPEKSYADSENRGLFTGDALDSEENYWTTGRMETFQEADHSLYGLKANANETKTLAIYTSPAGKTAFTNLVATVDVTGFGKIGKTADFTKYIYSTEDCSVKLAVTNATSTGLVIDSVEMKQWRGDNWDNLGTDIITIKPTSGETSAVSDFGRTNFTFNSAWVGNGWMRLSAKRTELNTTSYVRSPLMIDNEGRGRGLGMFAFTYANAQTNAVLELQFCTNGVTAATLSDIMRDDKVWETVERYDFSKMTAAERRDGTLRHYFGLHGVSGLMRLVVPKDAVAAVQGETNTNRFGEVTIKKLLCRDEPKLDSGCWWGWNLRTLGDKDDPEKRMYLPDAGDAGLSLALNNSITANLSDSETQYSDHLPFVQTPSFSEATRGVGEVSFKARKYLYTSSDTNATAAAALNARDAKVTLFGATRSGASQSALDNDDSHWTELTNFTVSATTYARYSCRLPQNASNYVAFRLAVNGVEGVTSESNHAPYDGVRVLIDDVLVSEAVYATLSFRKGTVGAFRSDMTGRGVVPNVPSAAEQPLAEEGWSVQGEVFASQLADEIDFGEEDPSRRPRVRLYWYRGAEPWGFENWKSRAEASGDASRAGAAWLDEAEGTNLWFRGSYSSTSGNTVGENDPNTTVQYMLETVYYMLDAKDPVTNALKKSEWENPSWYRGVDLNATLGGGQDENFSAYTFLDNVAPGWASINEVHLFEKYDDDANNLGRTNQYVEIRAPYVSLDGWSVRMVDVDPETQTIVTNTIATFGPGTGEVPPLKDSAYADEGNVFYVVASPLAAAGSGGALTKDNGTLDGVWKFPELPTTTFWNGGEIWALQPIGIQLVRANNVIEHEVVVLGTNLWNQSGISDSLRELHSPTGVVANLNALMPGSAFFHAGDDSYAVDGNGAYSVGVYTNRGETADCWNNTMACTPGRRNAGQTLERPPQAQGTRIAVYCSVSGDHILQTVGEGGATNATQVVYAPKGGSGTNITYTLDRWYALGSVTTNGVALANLPATVGRTAVVNVGAGCSNAVYVTATAGPSSNLDAYVAANDPYRAAILDWLSKGETLRGPFANDTEEVYIAKFRRYRQPTGIVTDESTFETNLNLKVMYWLDMDPTVSNQWLVGGWYKAPEPKLRQGGALTNLLLYVKMYMTNETEGVEAPAWAPYVLRGRTPGVTSHNYGTQALRIWNGVTFKPTGIMLNGNTSMSNLDNWMPLRLFVFDGSATGGTSYSFNSNCETVIEVTDPHSSQSPSFTGWYEWEQKYGRQFIGFFWSLDERQQPSLGVEKLKEENKYDGL